MVRIAVTNLGARRGGAWLFRGLSFQVDPASVLWIRGANGSGKTTLLKILAGLGRADEGSLWAAPAAADAGTGQGTPIYVGHMNALKEDLTVLESLRFLAEIHQHASQSSDLDAALSCLGMSHRRSAMVRTLSQGQRRRVTLARLALDRAPSLWILDEPFDALDSAGIQIVCQQMTAHVERGGSVVYTSHIEVAGPVGRSRSLQLDDN